MEGVFSSFADEGHRGGEWSGEERRGEVRVSYESTGRLGAGRKSRERRRVRRAKRACTLPLNSPQAPSALRREIECVLEKEEGRMGQHVGTLIGWQATRKQAPSRLEIKPDDMMGREEV
jgi:hypothetical protein